MARSPFPPGPSTPEAQALLQGRIVKEELHPAGSNYTFVVTLQDDLGVQRQAVYKPQKGEAPLGDFPWGTLYLREYAAYLLSEALGWHIVPTTVVRDGPHGTGVLQRYVEHDSSAHYFALEARYRPQLLRFALFDCLANNADRKGGHVLLDGSGKLWSIDHGLTFHAARKLRTVMHELDAAPVPDEVQQDLQRLCAHASDSGGIVEQLSSLLQEREVEAFLRRLALVASSPTIPLAQLIDPYRPMPWPPV